MRQLHGHAVCRISTRGELVAKEHPAESGTCTDSDPDLQLVMELAGVRKPNSDDAHFHGEGIAVKGSAGVGRLFNGDRLPSERETPQQAQSSEEHPGSPDHTRFHSRGRTNPFHQAFAVSRNTDAG